MRDSHCESTLLFQIIGRPVVVKLNSGVDYRGVNTETIIMKNSNYRPSAINQHIHKVLACLDGYMNIALEQTEEYVNGQVSLPMDKQCWIIIRIEIKTSEDLSSISHFFTAEEQIRRRIHSRQQCSLHLHSPQAVGWVWHRQLDRDGQLGEKVGKTLDQRHCEWSDTNSWQSEPPPFFSCVV